jgi:hypothetical protein
VSNYHSLHLFHIRCVLFFFFEAKRSITLRERVQQQQRRGKKERARELLLSYKNRNENESIHHHVKLAKVHGQDAVAVADDCCCCCMFFGGEASIKTTTVFQVRIINHQIFCLGYLNYGNFTNRIAAQWRVGLQQKKKI